VNDVSQICRTLGEHGEDIRVSCDRNGWSVEQADRTTFRSPDGRDVLLFLAGIISRYKIKE
jgi:hypothetical protein